MCGAAGMIALTAIQGINQYNQQKQQYNAQAAMYNTQAKLAENNARISQKKQEQIAEQYAAQQSKLNARMKLAAGQTAAQAGASGLQLSGSRSMPWHPAIVPGTMTARHCCRTSGMMSGPNGSMKSTTRTRPTHTGLVQPIC